MTGILCLGEPLVEFNQSASDKPLDYKMGFGGDISNVAVAAVRAGGSAGVISSLGEDKFGAELRNLWKMEGVDSSLVSTHLTAPTGLYFVSHGSDGHNFTYMRAGSAASLICEADLPLVAISHANILHTSGISLAISASSADCVFAAIAHARKNGTLVSFDTNLRLPLWPLERARALIHAAAKQSDILLPGFDDAKILTGLESPREIVDHYLDLGARVVALTLGAQGTLVATPAEQKMIPAIRVTPIDATGAGDTFDGAFLTRFLETEDPFEAAAFANVAGGLSTQGFGAVDPMPRRVDIDSCLSPD